MCVYVYTSYLDKTREVLHLLELKMLVLVSWQAGVLGIGS